MNKDQIIKGIAGTASGTKNLILKNTSESLRPKWLWFGVTDKCNSRCMNCDIWRKKPTNDVLTPNEVEKTLRDPLFRDVKYILNSGGEPTLRPDLEDIIIAEHKALPNARIQLSSNGLLPDRVINIVKSAMEHNINIDIGTSLDAIGDEHDLTRGIKGNFVKVDRLLRELVSLREEYGDKISVGFGFTLTNQTLPYLAEVRAYAQKLNIYCLVQWYNQSSFYSNIGNDLSCNHESMVQAVQSLQYPIISEMWLRWLKGESIKFSCFSMHTFCVLKCNGDISPCLSLWDIKAGNVRVNTPTEIWHSNDAKEARKRVKKCQGCLNSWGTGWSFSSSFYPFLFYALKHPDILMKNLIEK